MRIGKLRAWFLFAAVALIGLWLAPASAMQGQPPAGASEMPAHGNMHARHGMHVHIGMHAHQGQSVTAIGLDDVDCGDGLASSHHDACCGASMFSCCAPPSLLAAEPVTVLSVGAQISIAVSAETADGNHPTRLKRPPRLSL
jgi:hypothetical protein